MNKYKLKNDFSKDEIDQIIKLYSSPCHNFSSLAKKFRTIDDTIRNILVENQIKLKTRTESHLSSNINLEFTEQQNMYFNKHKIYFNKKKTPFIFIKWKEKPKRQYLFFTKCSHCGKEIIVVKNKKVKKHACSKKCRYDMFKGSAHPNWTGGVKEKTSGYLMDYSPKHPNAVQNYVLRHRLIIEKNLKRLLTKDEYVHHIDFNKKNNDITNLFLCDRKVHIKIHNSMYHMMSELMNKNIITFNTKETKYEIK